MAAVLYCLTRITLISVLELSVARHFAFPAGPEDA